ncbi:PREDICTED: E3 ubiquitin-protein ligase MYLIP [Nicrophorus vespilloides]|uniref:RING-type E3 ubiquitin transferase n=1 Tax=Nicrophorus vespilloides TaxID=110193 RepID=A0ABM1M7M0_NICVS|nr:PREDICTED: E3 ubiquitin-protein ligase MYLIP [Nicrophorus vespilloides]
MCANIIDEVCEQLGISKESDYFGLKYVSKGEELWLNLRNSIDKQVPIHNSLRFALRVKFWVPPHLLLQETTRHHFYLHARLDLIEKRLIASDWDTVAKLRALIAQVETGDYDPLHVANYNQTSTITKLEPDDKPQDLVQRVIAHHKNCKDMKASTAEYWLLKEVETLEGFGQEIFQSKPTGSVLGVGPHGITVYENDKNNQVIPFTAIQSASSHKRMFRLEYTGQEGEVTILETKFDTNHVASSLYRSITEKHAFYSCETVRSAVTDQFIRDLKGTIVSIFNEDSSLGKKYVFDIRRTCREVYDNARRALYQEDQLLSQNIHDLANRCDGENCEDSQKLARLLDALTCNICMDCQIDTAFLPCFHMLACSTCASKCERCPLCRADITQAQKIYFPGEFKQVC